MLWSSRYGIKRKVKMTNTLQICYYDNKGIKYLTNMKLEGAYDQSLYKLLLSLSRTLRQLEIPFFCDLKQDMDGIIQNCSFEINQKRYKELK